MHNKTCHCKKGKKVAKDGKRNTGASRRLCSLTTISDVHCKKVSSEPKEGRKRREKRLSVTLCTTLWLACSAVFSFTRKPFDGDGHDDDECTQEVVYLSGSSYKKAPAAAGDVVVQEAPKLLSSSSF